MKVQVEALESWFRIGDVCVYGVATPVPGMVVLGKEIGPDVFVDHGADVVIDYPGEYEVKDLFITAFVTGNTMHYIIKSVDGVFAIVANKSMLQNDAIGKVDLWLVADSSIVDEIKALELEGDVQMLS